MFAAIDHAGLRQEYNNAYYFPADLEGRWKEEMWFYRPRQSIHWKRAVVQTALSILPKPGPQLAFVFPLAIHRNKDRGLDSGKVPSVIYHEACHWALDRPGLLPASAFGNPIADAFCNYFAASILGKGIIGGLNAFMEPRRTRRIDRLSLVNGGDIRGSAKIPERQINPHLRSPFVASLFWSLRSQIGIAQTDALAWATLVELQGRASFRAMPEAIRAAAARKLALPAQRQIDMTLSRPEIERSFENLGILYPPDRYTPSTKAPVVLPNVIKGKTDNSASP